MHHILIAPNAFKGSLDASRVAQAILEGLQQSGLAFTADCFPVGDGGNGTGALIVKHFGGRRIMVSVHDPLGRPVESSFGLIENGRTAVIEMADAAGLQFLWPAELNPLRATSFGCGEMIRQALDLGVNRILVGMGGSATVDGGTGILRALGCRFLNATGELLDDGPEQLKALDHVDLSGMDKRLRGIELVVLCDVKNVLLGSQGAAAVFGPQKGADEEGVRQLDAALRQFQQVTLKQKGLDISTLPSGGTAGGAAAGLHAWCQGRLVNGIDYFLDLTGFDQALAKSSLVITGEGSIDEQTLEGKAPFGVASRAKRKGLPVIGLAGKIPAVPVPALDNFFDVLTAIGAGPESLPDAIRNTEVSLRRTARSIGSMLSVPQ
ncbi:MAG TPA: glycerate kinase [Puia sp.]|nr:glycerate kinase [Puia sp.]